MIRTFNHIAPIIAQNVYIDESALVIGAVTIGADSSIWPFVVLRADVNRIIIGERSSIQDGSIIHVTHQGSPSHSEGYATEIGHGVTVGHKVILHGCTIHDYCLIGMGSCVMDGVTIESEVILGAGSLVPPGKTLASGYLWLGAPARCARPLTPEERLSLSYSATHYVKLKDQYLKNNLA